MAGSQRLPLHTQRLMARAGINRAFALLYSCAILALLCHHFIDLLQSTSMVPIFLLLADSMLAFMWVIAQAFRMYPTHRQVFIEHLEHYVKESDYPGLDVFICTADPYKEPPMGVVNTALSVMAYDYPIEKLSVYVSDDGGSKFTLFAFMEAARFAAHWLPYCRKNKVVERCPKAHFGSSNPPSSQRPIRLSEGGECDKERSISHDYITKQGESEALSRWTDGFTPQNHPPVVQVLLEYGKDNDATGHGMPNLVYISREKTQILHTISRLLRVSATMTNAPVILTLDSDMYSNDPQTPLRALCYLLDPSMDPKLGYIQFPQVFHGINKNDIYGGEMRHAPHTCRLWRFFRRRVFYGCPSETLEINWDRQVSHSINSREVLAMAHHVAGCKYENQTKWGRKMGFRYGTLVEDLYTSCLMQCEGWKSIYCNPKRPAFLGESPINLHDFLNQTMRWSVGLLEVAFSRYSPITFGVRSISLLSGLCFAHYTFWAIWGIPFTIYAFLPQLALLNSASIFPKISDPWFLLYVVLFLGAYGQDYLEFLLSGRPTQRWWNHQRAWMMRGLSSFTFGLVEYLLKYVGISTFGFNVTSKVVEEEQSKRYQKGIFEFGVPSPIFLPLTTAAIINLVAFLSGFAKACRQRSLEDVFLQMFLAGFAVVNCWPVYEAMAWRRDQGKLPLKITVISVVLAWALYSASSMAF
ncbi:hypothetical protein AAG906_034199 [Vitis piasezkii]